MLARCLQLRRGLGNPVDVASTLTALSTAPLRAGDTGSASAAQHEALQIQRQLGHRVGEAIGLIHLGQIEIYEGNDSKAREHLEQALGIARTLKHQEAEAVCELALGETAFEEGDQPRAYVRITRSMTVCKAAGDRRGEVTALWWLGRLDLQGGNLEQARQRLAEALQAFRSFEMRTDLLTCLEDHSALLSLSGACEMAVKLAAAASTLRMRLGLARSPRAEQRWLAHAASLTQVVPSETFATLWAEGECWELENAMSSALAAH